MDIEIKNSLQALQNNRLILYPTDTVWGLGCDATCEKSVSEIYKVKNRISSKSLIILVQDIEMLKTYIPKVSDQLIKFVNEAEKPTTVIYSNPIGLPKNMIAEDGTVAIRIPKSEFCKQLLQEFGKPIVSTSANVSGEITPQCFSEISEKIIEKVDYVVNTDRDLKNGKPSTIVKLLEDGSLEIIRS
jgi:L-threonylcarbamoyladenylate synthase